MKRPKGPAPSRERWLKTAVPGGWLWMWYGKYSRRANWVWCALCGMHQVSACEHLWEMVMAKRPTCVSGLPEGEDDGSWEMPVSLPNHVFLAELLAAPLWEDKTKKGERALFVFVRTGSVLTTLKVQHPALKLTAIAPTVDASLAALELLLANDDTTWQHDPSPLGPKRKK